MDLGELLSLSSQQSNYFNFFEIFSKKCLTLLTFACIISLVFTRNKSKHTIQYARVAQWWSTSLPRRGSRVRSPSRALKKIKQDIPMDILFYFFESNPGLEGSNLLRFASVVAKPRSTGPCATSRAY